MDMNSRSGTFVNNERVTSPKRLKDGDTIRAGRTVFRVSIPTPATTILPDGQIAPTDDDNTPIIDLEPDTRTRPHDPGHIEAMNRITPNVFDGPIIPGYTIDAKLGEGGMGTVWRATRKSDGIAVAIKTVLPAHRGSEKTMQRFLREAEILQKLSHPHIVPFRQIDKTDGLLFFVMDLIDGLDAGKLVKSQGPLSVPRAVRLTQQLCDALGYAHDQGFVHRDVKPSNVLVSRDSLGLEHAQLADFGLARTYQASAMSGLTLVSDTCGTPEFMPPEQATEFRFVKPTADQFSAGATLYYLLTGTTAYDGGGVAHERILRVALTEPIRLRDRNADLPAELEKIVHRAMARKPTDRFPDVRAFATALQPFA